MHYRLEVLVRGAIEGMYVVYTHTFRDLICLIVTYSSETTNAYHSVPSSPTSAAIIHKALEKIGVCGLLLPLDWEITGITFCYSISHRAKFRASNRNS
jgi:hypothetical protein